MKSQRWKKFLFDECPCFECLRPENKHKKSPFTCLSVGPVCRHNKFRRSYRIQTKFGGCILGWPKFDLHFLIFSLTRKFCSFWSNNGPREGFSLAKNIYGRSTNLKIEKSGFFLCFFAILTPYFISFPDT